MIAQQGQATVAGPPCGWRGCTAGIRNVRTDFLHKLSTSLATTKSVVVLEDLGEAGIGRGRFVHWLRNGSYARLTLRDPQHTYEYEVVSGR